MYVCLHFLNVRLVDLSFFFFNDTATTEIYTLSLHDALPILGKASRFPQDPSETGERARRSRHRIARQGPWPRAFVSGTRCFGNRAAACKLKSRHASSRMVATRRSHAGLHARSKRGGSRTQRTIEQLSIERRDPDDTRSPAAKRVRSPAHQEPGPQILTRDPREARHLPMRRRPASSRNPYRTGLVPSCRSAFL